MGSILAPIPFCDFQYKKRWVAKHHPANQPFLIKGVDVLSPPLVLLLYLSTKKIANTCVPNLGMQVMSSVVRKNFRH